MTSNSIPLKKQLQNAVQMEEPERSMKGCGHMHVFMCLQARNSGQLKITNILQ